MPATESLTRALLLENIHPDARARLAKDGCQVDTLPRALTEDELVSAVDGVQLLGIRSGTHVTERVLDAAPDLLAIGAFCIGVNQIDLAAASRRGVAVFNAPFSNTRSVVELALAEIIALTRRLTDKNRQMHAVGGTSRPRAATRSAGGGSASSATATSAASCPCWPRRSA
jgi:D-3-phosphoglycerate dehydrogenase / 2-oxoglutarate reductase